MFSIIMPVYNGEKFIDNAINSILRQKINDWELIIVNDGSKDNTADVLEKYKTNEKITIITQKNGGVSVARNNGMNASKGSHIVFLDADDEWHENHLEVMQKLISKYPDAGLYGTFTKTELVNGNEITECSFFKNKPDDVYLPDFFEEYHKDKSAKMFTVITTCISREALNKSGGFPVGCAIGEDLELSLTIAAHFPVVLSKIITATYKKENSTATKTRSFDPDWGFFERVKSLYADNTICESKKENIKKVMDWFMMRRCRHYIITGNKAKAKQVFAETNKGNLSKKDILINKILLTLPSVAVRFIFTIRWRGKA